MEAERAGSLLSPGGIRSATTSKPGGPLSLWPIGPLGPRSYDEASMSSELEASN